MNSTESYSSSGRLPHAQDGIICPSSGLSRVQAGPEILEEVASPSWENSEVCRVWGEVISDRGWVTEAWLHYYLIWVFGWLFFPLQYLTKQLQNQNNQKNKKKKKCKEIVQIFVKLKLIFYLVLYYKGGNSEVFKKKKKKKKKKKIINFGITQAF